MRGKISRDIKRRPQQSSSDPARSEQSWLFAQENNGKKFCPVCLLSHSAFSFSIHTRFASSLSQSPMLCISLPHTSSHAHFSSPPRQIRDFSFFWLVTPVRRVAAKTKQSSSSLSLTHTRRLCVSDAHVIDPCYRDICDRNSAGNFWHTEILRDDTRIYLRLVQNWDCLTYRKEP